MDHEQIPLLAQEIGAWVVGGIERQTKDLVEAMPCTCEKAESFIAEDKSYMSYKKEVCKRCLKLEELKGK